MLAHLPEGVGAGQVAAKPVGLCAAAAVERQEFRDVAEAEFAAIAREREPVEMGLLPVEPGLDDMVAAVQGQRVAQLKQILLVFHGNGRNRAGRRGADDVDGAPVRIHGEVERGRDGDGRDQVVVAAGAVGRELQRVQHLRSEQLLELRGEVAGIGAHRFPKQRVRLRNLGRRHVPRPAHHEIAAGVQVVVKLHDAEVLVGGIQVRVHQFGRAVAEVAAGRDRIQQVEIRPDGRVHSDVHQLALGVGHHALARQRIRQTGEAGDGEPLDQTFIAAEVEQLVLDDRAADGRAELVALEIGQLAGVEEVAGVQGRIAMELEYRPANPVGARLGHGAHDAAGRAAELGAVAVRLHAELLHRVDAEQHAREARRRLVGDVGDVGAVHQVAGLLRPRAADRQLRAAEATREVARGSTADDDARLEGGQLHEAPAVQGQFRDLLRGHDTASGGGAQ